MFSDLEGGTWEEEWMYDVTRSALHLQCSVSYGLCGDNWIKCSRAGVTDEPQMLDENGTNTQNNLEERKHMVEAPPCFLCSIPHSAGILRPIYSMLGTRGWGLVSEPLLCPK